MMKRGIEIRPMRIDDVRNVFLLGRELLPPEPAAADRAWNESNLSDTLASGLDFSFIAAIKKKIAGFIIAVPDGRETGDDAVSIAWLCAPPDAGGIRESLLNALLGKMTKKSNPRVRAHLSAENSDLYDLLQKFGFTESKHLVIMENFPPKRNG